MAGNSYTYYSDMPFMLKNITGSLGGELFTGCPYPGKWNWCGSYTIFK
jgi:hypothetical protein